MGRIVRLPASVLLATCIACGGAALAQRIPVTDHDWTRFGWDAARTSAPDVPAGISRSDLSSLVRQQVALDGTVDASAIYLHAVEVAGSVRDVFFVTTTYGRTMAIDADSGAVLWTYTPPGYQGWAGTYRITTATPVADPDRRYLYAAAPDGRIRKLAVTDGHEVWSTAVTTLPQREKIAAALNYADGHVLVTTGGYIGDRPPYQGHVAVLDAASGKIENVWNSLCSDRTGLIEPTSCPQSDSAIWGRAGAVVDPVTGDLFVATGNGPWNGSTDWGDAVLELSPDAGRLLANYTPTNTAQLNARDQDLGSTAPALLGNGLVAQGGKDGKIRLLDLNAIRGNEPHKGGAVQTVSTPSGADLFTAPAVWRQGGVTWLFASDNGGTAAWRLESGRLRQVWHNATGGTSPIVAGGLLYVYNPRGGLHVYDPATGDQLANLPAGPGHWNSPIVTDGRIALPEGNANAHRTSGVLDIWRLPR